MSAAPSFHIRQHVEGSHRGYRSDVKPTAVEAASLFLEWSGEAASVSTVAERLLDGEQVSSERDGVIVVATPQFEYVAVDLDENNRHIIEAQRERFPDRELLPLGWGVCRRGHGLQDLPPLSERQAVELAGKLNGGGPAEVADPDDADTATLALEVEMGEHVQSAAEVAGVVGWFVEDHREQLEAGGFVSGPIRNEDGDRVGRYRIAFPLS